MKRTNEFTLYKLANDFRFLFTTRLSNKALENSWGSSIKVETNEAQDAFFFSQQVKYDTDRVMEGVYRDMMDVLESIRNEEWLFDVNMVRKGYELEVTNIRRGTQKEGIANSDYFNGVVKRTLAELNDSIKKAKNDSEANFYKGRYEAQLNDFAKALEMSEEELSLMIDEQGSMQERRKIYVYNDEGHDTRTIIVYSEKEKCDEVSKLKAAGYTEKRDDEFPSCVFEIR